MSSCGTCEENYISRIASLRQQVAELNELVEALERLDTSRYEGIETLHQQLNECKKDLSDRDDEFIATLGHVKRLKKQLANMTAYADKRNSVALDLQQQLATMQQAYVDAGNQHGLTLDKLRECERKRYELQTKHDETFTHLKNAMITSDSWAAKYGTLLAQIDSLEQLASVTKERDELVDALKQWVACCEASKSIRTEVAIPLRALAKVGDDKNWRVK